MVDSLVRRRACSRGLEYDINVAACQFYAAMGFSLALVNEDAYSGLNEAQLLWRLTL